MALTDKVVNSINAIGKMIVSEDTELSLARGVWEDRRNEIRVGRGFCLELESFRNDFSNALIFLERANGGRQLITSQTGPKRAHP